MPCLLWLVQVLAATGRTAAVHVLFTELFALASPFGLYGEEIDPPATATLATTRKPSRRLAAASRPVSRA